MLKAIWSLAAACLLWLLVVAPTARVCGGGRRAAAEAQISRFLVALDAYRSDVREFPSEAEGLGALHVDRGKPHWSGPYFTEDIPLDPWGERYEYRLVGGRPYITYRGSRSR